MQRIATGRLKVNDKTPIFCPRENVLGFYPDHRQSLGYSLAWLVKPTTSMIQAARKEKAKLETIVVRPKTSSVSDAH